MATFNFTYDVGTNLQQMIGFETAGRVWSSYLQDNMTVNIHVGVASSSSLGSKVIGGALPGMRANQNYQTFYNSLKADRTSLSDYVAVSSLQSGFLYTAQFDKFVNGINKGDTAFTSTLNMTRANAKSVGMLASSTALDGYILFSDLANQPVQWSYDYTRSGAAPSNSLDFLSTAIHEIGHVLGFVSGVDQPGWLNSTIATSLLDPLGLLGGMTYDQSLDQRVTYTNPLDLFRYTSQSSKKLIPVPDMSYGSQGGVKYFSLDKGKIAIAQFSTGTDTSLGGDGQQASHWKAGTPSIMAPTLATGQRSSISLLDLGIFDAIGYNIAYNNIDLSALSNQSVQALATRAGQSTAWVTSNQALSPTSLVADRSQDIYNMAIDSSIYDLTRITSSGSTGTVSRQALAQMFQERGLFETLDELQIIADTPEAQPTITVAGAGLLTTPGTDMPQLPNRARTIVAIQTITQFYMNDQVGSNAPASTGRQLQKLEFSGQTLTAAMSQVTPGGQSRQSFHASSQRRAYDSGLRYRSNDTADRSSSQANRQFAIDQFLLEIAPL